MITCSCDLILSRYPVILKQFAVNEGSGGDGLFVGGHGVIRETLFRRCLTLCVLSERRGQYKPYGMDGVHNLCLFAVNKFLVKCFVEVVVQVRLARTGSLDMVVTERT